MRKGRKLCLINNEQSSDGFMIPTIPLAWITDVSIAVVKALTCY